MKILLATETYLPYITGVSISSDSIARYMVSQGHEVTLVCPKPVVKGTVKKLDGLTVVHIPTIPFPVFNYNALAIFPLGIPIINRLIRKNRFDVIHIQEPGVTGISTLILAKAYHIPVLGAMHFIPEQTDEIILGRFKRFLTPVINNYIKFIYKYYDAIMTPSNFFANYLRKDGIQKPIFVISNGTDINKFHPGVVDWSLRERLGISKDLFTFFYFGRLDGDKNVKTLIEAMPFTGQNIRLLIVGKGRKKEKLFKLAKKVKADSKIIWVNYITDEEMPRFYHAVNAFAIMSPYEGQSIVTLQAVASGLPVIAANAGALPELCHDGENGFLVATYDFRTLAKRMNEVAGSHDLVKKFGLESRKISLAHNKPTVLHKLEDVYQNLLKR